MKRKKHKAIKIIAIILGCILAALLLFAGSILLMLNGRVKNLTQLDEEGYLYYAEYEGNYYNPLISAPCRLIQNSGCSAFLVKDEYRKIVTCRNYDLSHVDDDNKSTGLNVVLRLNPEGKYRSINVADAAWITYLNLPYYNGALSDRKTTKLPLAFLPYLCMDGINEKGLSVSILALDVKEGEQAVHQSVEGKKTILYEELLRYILDSCATVKEAEELAGEYNIHNIIGNDYHLFVTDENGKSIVLEWRNNVLNIVQQDVVTNFYTGFDDADESFRDGILKERISDVENIYHFGYGHGYDRFLIIADTIDAHREKNGLAVLSRREMLDTLEKVTQDFSADGTSSQTQYHALYCNTDRTLDIWAQPSYEKQFSFSVQK